MSEPEIRDRLRNYTRESGVVVERTIETQSSLIAFGMQNCIALDTRNSEPRPVVLKIIKRPGDEWWAGEVLHAFDGRGVVRVYERTPGAVLMERLRPGTPLVDLVLNGKDEEATDILADVIQRMCQLPGVGYRVPGVRCQTPLKDSSETQYSSNDVQHSLADARHPAPDTRYPTPPFPTVHDWVRGFDRYIASGDKQIPRDLVESAQQTYLKLAKTQRNTRLLHGDLQHYNILFDSDRGWVAIDPKGVAGEVEYEIGAAIRNPVECPHVFLSRTTIERRLRQFTGRLNLDYDRAIRWTFAQAVLSAIWNVEDDDRLYPGSSSLLLAHAIQPLID